MSARKKQRRRACQCEQTNRRRQRQEEEQRWLQRPLDDRQILTFKEWCLLNRVSERNGRRILAGEFGPGPVVTMLSARRIGISVAANRAWQESRARAA